jgi:aminopeptidase
MNQLLNDFNQKIAKLVVNYSVDVKKGDHVFIRSFPFCTDMHTEIIKEVLKAGGHPFLMLKDLSMTELFFKFANNDQISYVDPFELFVYENFNKLIYIDAETNTKGMEKIDPVKLAKFSAAPQRKQNREIFEDRSVKGELLWVLLPYPCDAHAQEAGMDKFTYQELIEKALMLDKEDPAAEWRKVKVEQQRLVEILNKVNRIQVVGEDTDLQFSVKGRTWSNCCGDCNLPDGEVFTGPIEDSINGHIRFTYPGVYDGRDIENIYLEFNNGKVVKSTATKGEEYLHEILKVDGADGVGEFAIGTNYNITEFIKNMLFDEKIGGTLHMALGRGYKETGSMQASAIHWDILKDMKKPGSKITADGKVIYKEGKWKI